MKKPQFNTPILFIIFNRPDVTKKSFESIRKIKPRELYIVADGPRLSRGGEIDLCLKARIITENIDWKCDVHRLYRKSNLGCGKSVSGAINWFFKNVENGIILEDDCVPNNHFYKFMGEMLVKHKNNVKIMHISGDNFLPIYKSDDSYFMTKYAHVWGWATWKRAWNKYDFNMSFWRKKNIFKKIISIKGSIWNKIYWTSKFDSVAYGMTNTWDYQWIYSLISNSSLAIFPSENLVTNIGFNNDSTHTQNNVYNNIKSTIRTNDDINTLEEKYIFKVNSLMTILNFAYFSIFGMLYNKVKLILK